VRPSRPIPDSLKPPNAIPKSVQKVVPAPGALDTKGGPVIDERARVLKVSGTPVPGLYGAGNCIPFPAGQAYWGSGGTVGPALAFGYVAGRSAAEVEPRQGFPQFS
jgi:predicted oxidoreductase